MKNIIYYLIIIIIALVGIKALFHPGFYTSHDGRHQIVRLAHFHQGLIDGQMPVRWAGTALNGFGYPLFIFTYRLPFWIAEFWYILNKNLVDAIKFSFIITYVFSGVTMFLLAKEVWESKLAGFVSAVLYLWAPYRFVNIFVRAALGEAVTFTFLPLLFLGILFLSKKKTRIGIFLTCLSLSAVMLSHAMTLVLWILPLILWLTLNFLLALNKKAYLVETAISFIWSALLTTYYWLPATWEKKHTIFSSLMGDYYKDHFLSLKQLIYSKWGYGFSMAGVENDAMSFQVGIAQWLVVFLVVLYILIVLFKPLKLNSLFTKINRLRLYYMIFLLLVLTLSIYLMMPQAEWFYEWIKKLMIIDIPWRFLGVSVFSISLLSGALIVVLKNLKIKLLLLFFIISLSFYGNRNHLNVNQYTYYPDREYWQDQETTNEHNDYTPKEFLNHLDENGNYQLLTIEGKSLNKILVKKSNYLRFYSEVSSAKVKILTRIADYPGWQLFIDGKKEKISFKDGKISIVLSKGNHLITLIFRETNLRQFSDWLSLISLLLFIVYYIKDVKKIIYSKT